MKYSAILAVLCSCFSLYPQPVSPLPAPILEQLEQNGEFVNYFFKDELPSHIPETGMKNSIMSRYLSLSIQMGVEVYFSLPYPESLDNSEEIELLIYNVLHRISRLEGIKYYSASRKKMRTFFSRAYIIDSPGNPVRLDDPVFEAIPPFDSRYYFQEDLTFGRNISHAFYEYDRQTIMLTILNKTVMKYIFPVIPVDGLLMTLQIIPGENVLYFYGACGVDMTGLLGLERSKKESFYNRLKAMFNWFAAEIILTDPESNR